MKIKIFPAKEIDLPYFQKGKNPKWLIHSGTHGDEAGVILSIKKFLGKNLAQLPDFIWVGEVSPSAVRLGTRKNARGADLNRCFLGDGKDPEAAANIALIKNKKFDLYLSFHEDVTSSHFYLYDSEDAWDTPELKKMYSAIKLLGVKPYEGLDDLDPALQNMIVNGYLPLRPNNKSVVQDNGTSESFIINHSIALRSLTPEIPTLQSPVIKDRLVELIFEYALRVK